MMPIIAIKNYGLDLKMANEITLEKQFDETEILQKLCPIAKKIKLYSKRGTLFEKLIPSDRI